jgi:hypothetical protein
VTRARTRVVHRAVRRAPLVPAVLALRAHGHPLTP